MKSIPRDGHLRGGRALLIRALLLAAAGVSGYLLSVSLQGGQVAGCGPGSACDSVLTSRWAYVFGLPVSALAVILDVGLLLTTFSCGGKSTARQRRGAWELLAPGAMLLLGAGLWFTALQALVLKQFCPWCLSAHGCGALAAVLLLTRLPLTEARERRDKDPGVSRGALARGVVVALVGLAALGAAQSLAPGKSHTDSVVPANTMVATPNVLEMFGGRVKLDLAQVPVWGSPHAPQKMISLFDYTCHHCRDMHERVVAVHRTFSNQLAVVSLPMPLDAECNHLLTRTHPKQTNACLYAKLGLAVWRAKPGAIEQYDDWFFTPATPPSLAEVTNKAVQLAGAENFARACHDPWIDAQIAASIELFGISMHEYHNGQMPQFMIGTNILSGEMSVEDLRNKVGSYVMPAVH